MIPLGDENPTRSYPVVTVTLIVLNVTAYLVNFLVAPRSLDMYMMIPCAVLGSCPHIAMATPDPEFLMVFTSMFLHGGLLHLAGNMLYLWIFGNNVEDVLGHGRFLVLYLFWGVIAALSHLLADPMSQIPTLGASGAVAGVLGAYLVLFPYARVRVLTLFIVLTIITVPAMVLLVLWFAMQVLLPQPGVAVMAHIGGFIAGYLTLRVMGPARLKRDAYWRSIGGR